MKKLFSIVIVLVFALSSIQKTGAQTFDTDSKVLNVGIGFGYTYGFLGGASSWPALSVSFEKGFKELDNLGVLSLGGIVALQHASYYDYKWNDVIVGGRGALHFAAIDVDKLDVYGGVSLGLRFYSSPEWNYSSLAVENKTHTGAFIGLYGGGRYYFTDKIAAFGELGWEITWFKFGLSIKF